MSINSTVCVICVVCAAPWQDLQEILCLNSLMKLWWSLCVRASSLLTSDDLPKDRSWSQSLFHKQCPDPSTEADPEAYRPRCTSLPPPRSPAPQGPDLHTHTQTRISSSRRWWQQMLNKKIKVDKKKQKKTLQAILKLIFLTAIKCRGVVQEENRECPNYKHLYIICLCSSVCELTRFILVIVDVNIIGLHDHKAFTHQSGRSGWEIHKV